jgi:uncharacterized protein (TIGR00159 family)
MGFIFENIRILDILDILLVAVLLYQLYMLIRGTVAINIFYGVFILYFTWLLVKALNMQLLGSILGQVIGLGLIALIIVFQQEVRRFLLILGTRYSRNTRFSFERLFNFRQGQEHEWDFDSILEACKNMSKTRTGALIVLAKTSELRAFSETGQFINGKISSALLESIFQTGSPLHDGAAILVKNQIRAARCVLPLTENPAVPDFLGMRHRAALGMTESSDSFVIVVSEETGDISYANQSQFFYKVSPDKLKSALKEAFKEN